MQQGVACQGASQRFAASAGYDRRGDQPDGNHHRKSEIYNCPGPKEGGKPRKLLRPRQLLWQISLRSYSVFPDLYWVLPRRLVICFGFIVQLPVARSRKTGDIVIVIDQKASPNQKLTVRRELDWNQNSQHKSTE